MIARLARWWALVQEVIEFRHARAVYRLPERDLQAERDARKAYRERMGRNRSRQEWLAARPHLDTQERP